MPTDPYRRQLSARHIPFHTLRYVTKHGQLSQHGYTVLKTPRYNL